ncbi:MAG: alkaline phosphatase [Algoriphagus sp.]|jgi:alkaline phosphatase|nr:alkaline phosphatase [Algoriphagus sp.]
MKKILSFLWVAFFAACFQSAFAQRPFALHSHNDYLQTVPFWDAFSAGSASIEVDVILQNGDLMAAHEKETIAPTRTLRSLYLEPIQHAVQVGLIQEFDFHLLVDFKTEAYSTMEVLVDQMKPYSEMLYSERNPKGLKLIISGSRPKPDDYRKYPEWAFFDYQSLQLTQDLPWEKIGMVSLSFSRFSVWNGKGRMVQAELEKLKAFIDLVHSFDRPVRFWASPDSKSAWKAFHDLGVDYINTDQPYEAQKYLSTLGKNIYRLPQLQQVYRPTFEHDGQEIPLKQIILMIGDGNGLAQISSGLFTNGNELSLTQLKNMGLVKTQAADDFTTDSAAGATAYATGKKANNRALGIDSSGDTLVNLPAILRERGFRSGIITTDELTGATPAAFFAHHAERDDAGIIASFLAKSSLDLVIGGGKRHFYPYLSDLSRVGFEQVNSLEAMGQSAASKLIYFLGDGAPASIESGRGPILSKASQEAVSFLAKGNSPIFLMIEAAKIDSGGHANSSSTIVTELLDFDLAIGEMIRYADQHPGTLVLITADHETGGVSLPQGNLDRNEVELAYHSDDHTGILVPIFAYGAHSGEFRGVYENTEVFKKLDYLVSRYFPDKK